MLAHADSHFRLLRHDTVAPLAEVLQALRSRGGAGRLKVGHGGAWSVLMTPVHSHAQPAGTSDRSNLRTASPSVSLVACTPRLAA